MVSKIIHTKGFKWLIALTLIVIFLVSYANAGKLYIKNTTTHGNAPTEKERLNYENISVTYEKNMPGNVLEQCRAAIEKMPVDAVSGFIGEDWKIVVTSEITLPKETNLSVMVDGNSSVIGYTDYQQRTLNVLCNDQQPSVTIPLAHEFCHYNDKFFGELYFANDGFYTEPPEVYLVSFTKDFEKLFLEYRDTYVEFEKSGIIRSEDNEMDFTYPVSNPEEFFACSLKDYLMHPSYIKTHYCDLYSFFNLMLDGNLPKYGR